MNTQKNENQSSQVKTPHLNEDNRDNRSGGQGQDQKYSEQGYLHPSKQGQVGMQQGNSEQQFQRDRDSEKDEKSESGIKHRFNPGDLEEEGDEKEFGPNRTMAKQNTLQGGKRNDSNVGNSSLAGQQNGDSALDTQPGKDGGDSALDTQAGGSNRK